MTIKKFDVFLRQRTVRRIHYLQGRRTTEEMIRYLNRKPR